MLLVEVLCKLNVYLATLLDIPVSPVTLLISIFFSYLQGRTAISSPLISEVIAFSFSNYDFK